MLVGPKLVTRVRNEMLKQGVRNESGGYVYQQITQLVNIELEFHKNNGLLVVDIAIVSVVNQETHLAWLERP